MNIKIVLQTTFSSFVSLFFIFFASSNFVNAQNPANPFEGQQTPSQQEAEKFAQDQQINEAISQKEIFVPSRDKNAAKSQYCRAYYLDAFSKNTYAKTKLKACVDGVVQKVSGVKAADSCMKYHSTTGANPILFDTCRLAYGATDASQKTLIGGYSSKDVVEQAKRASSAAVAASASSSTKDQADCDASGSGFNLSWIACPIIDAGVGMTDWVFSNLVEPLLEDVPVGTDGDYNEVWQTFRVFGNIVLVGALLLMVFAQNFGRFVDAYTVKRMAPRIVVGAIAINLSIYLAVLAVDVVNVIGSGIGQILVGPFVDGFDPTSKGIKLETNNIESSAVGLLGAGLLTALVGAGGAIFVAGLAGAAAVSAIGLLLPIIITVVLVALAVLFTLIIRQALIIFLVIISPVAIALFILPNTEKYFRQWWSLFLKTLLVYPIISVLFAMSNVMIIILLSASVKSGDSVGVAQVIAAILIAFAPLAMIPFAFKFAGGAIGAVMNTAQGVASSMSARARKGIETSRQNPNTWLGAGAARFRTGRTENGLTAGQIASGLRGGVQARLKNRSFRTGYSAASSVKSRGSAFDEATAFMENSAAFKSISGNDDAVWAFRHGRNEEEVRRLLQQRGITDPTALAENTAAIMKARSEVGDRALSIAAVRAQAKTGTGWEDNAQMLDDISQASGGDMALAGRTLAEARSSAVQAGQVHLGTASFATQAQVMENLNRARLNNGMIEDPDWNGIGPANMVHYGANQANAEVMESVIDSVSPGQAIYGKPGSARAIAGARAARIQGIVNGIQAGTHTQRDLDQELASTMGIHDAMSSASPQNAREFADVLMNANIQDPVNTGDNNEPIETNIFEFANSSYTTGNPAFTQMKQHFARDTLERAQAEQMNAAQAAAQQQQAPGPPGPPQNPF